MQQTHLCYSFLDSANSNFLWQLWKLPNYKITFSALFVWKILPNVVQYSKKQTRKFYLFYISQWKISHYYTIDIWLSFCTFRTFCLFFFLKFHLLPTLFLLSEMYFRFHRESFIMRVPFQQPQNKWEIPNRKCV